MSSYQPAMALQACSHAALITLQSVWLCTCWYELLENGCLHPRPSHGIRVVVAWGLTC